MNISISKPKFVTFNLSEGYIINAFIKNRIINEVSLIEYLPVSVRKLTYENIISELINVIYTQDQVTAITLNYLLTLHEEVIEPEKVKEYQQDYKELQEYRAACKAEAKRAIEYVKENQIGLAWKDL